MLDLQQLLRTKKFREQESITIHDMYTLYPHKDKVSLHEFKVILRTFNQILNEYIIYSGHLIQLPRRLGTLSIRTTPPSKNRMADYKYFRETGEIIYYQNYETEGKLVTFYWDKSSPYNMQPLAKFFRFKPLKLAKAKLSKVVTELLTINKYYPKA